MSVIPRKITIAPIGLQIKILKAPIALQSSSFSAFATFFYSRASNYRSRIQPLSLRLLTAV